MQTRTLQSTATVVVISEEQLIKALNALPKDDESHSVPLLPILSNYLSNCLYIVYSIPTTIC